MLINCVYDVANRGKKVVFVSKRKQNSKIISCSKNVSLESSDCFQYWNWQAQICHNNSLFFWQFSSRGLEFWERAGTQQQQQQQTQKQLSVTLTGQTDLSMRLAIQTNWNRKKIQEIFELTSQICSDVDFQNFRLKNEEIFSAPKKMILCVITCLAFSTGTHCKNDALLLRMKECSDSQKMTWGRY
jgi:hypothetical protein